jgi:polysaccharide deacetylase family protein (PEP-CTERM system associated)
MTPKHLLSFHVEEHFHAAAFDSPMRRRHWDRFASRVERNTDKILEVLAERGVKATFFVLGWVAERQPQLIKRIAQGGHEIASHGYAHELVTAQTKKQFREDIRKTKLILEELAGELVLGYRAPGYSVTEETNWALPILVEEGYRYDSSLSAIPNETCRGSICFRHDVKGGSLWEFPLGRLRMAGLAFPANGFSLRVFGYQLVRRAIKLAEANNKCTLMHLRVWEVDPNQPHMKGRALARFQQYYNLAKVENGLRTLIQDFQFSPLREAIKPEEPAVLTTVASFEAV